MKCDEFNRIYRDVTQIFVGNSINFPKEDFPYVADAMRYTSRQNPLHFFQRILATAERAIEAFPHLSDVRSRGFFEEDGAILLSSLYDKGSRHFYGDGENMRQCSGAEARINDFAIRLREFQGMLKGTFLVDHCAEHRKSSKENALSNNILHFNFLERDIRRAISPIQHDSDGFRHNREEAIEVSAINISERCLGQCPTCMVDALPTHAQMPWALFRALITNLQIELDPFCLHLMDGEPLIYRDEKADKNLVDVIKALLFEKVVSRQVGFATAGLIPPNRELGLEVMKGLEELGPFGTEVRIDLSFNYLFGNMGTVGEYIRAIEETLELLARTTCRIAAMTVMADEENEEEVKENAKALARQFGIDEINERKPSPLGRALETREWSAEQLEKYMLEPKFCLAKSTKPDFKVRANGDVTNACLCSGTRGSTIGNLFDNDVKQLTALYRLFLKELAMLHGTKDPHMHICEAHRIWNKSFRAPRSRNPVLNGSLRKIFPDREQSRKALCR